ncbi:uncharacterized protein LOC110242080 [Exaiptasia diaphana]|uniref:Uncharacterized protein n=1 Tax=Exaiptasia diaphana TaxID=2652724 RepID=A0A913XFM2_EXADI|nr:uncharacterized protein LOC110242080 [Exaiptasia diaphana]KXJ26200.1 hypothetical protein AC249_AIPGENE3377 [Exaiptasia diaphana]
MSLTVLQAIVLITLCVIHIFADRTEIADDSLARDGPIEQQHVSPSLETWFNKAYLSNRGPLGQKEMKCGASRGDYGNDEELPEVKCSAHETVVSVGNPYGAISYEPSYVKVKRCIGKALPRTRCAPVKHRYRYRNVKVQKFIGDKQVATCVVPIREDLRCQFTCIKSQRDCKSGEIFDSSRCACKSKSG